MREPDVTIYPETRKLAVFAGAAPGGPKAARSVDVILDADAQLDDWAREAPWTPPRRQTLKRRDLPHQAGSARSDRA